MASRGVVCDPFVPTIEYCGKNQVPWRKKEGHTSVAPHDTLALMGHPEEGVDFHRPLVSPTPQE